MLDAALDTARRLVELEPLQESVHRTLMELYARQGQRALAVRQYQVCVEILERELTAEPDQATRQLYQRLLHDSAGPEKPAAESRVGRAPPRAAALGDSPSPLIGREAELSELAQVLDEAGREQGRVMVLLGEAGIGKTRLIDAVARTATQRGLRVVVGHCFEGEQVLPFGPWIDLLRRERIADDRKLLEALEPVHRRELARLLPELGGARGPTGIGHAGRLFDAVVRVLQLVAARTPLVVILEDVHWADDLSLRLLAFAARRAAGRVALFLATARPEALEDATPLRGVLRALDRDRCVERLGLGPLDRESTMRLVAAVRFAALPESEAQQLGERVWQIGQGHPFMTIELVRAIQSGQRLDRVPERIEQLLAARLDRLTPRAQEVAAVAAVIGRSFDFPLLVRSSGLDEAETAGAVDELVRRYVLQDAGGRLDFRHTAIRDVVYASLVTPRRHLVHRRVLEAIEALNAARLAPDAARPAADTEWLAHHAVRAEMPDKAVRYLRQAGATAAARSALVDARARFGQALGLLAALPESRARIEQAFEIRLELRPVLGQLGEGRQMLERVREAETLAERLDDDRRRAQVCAFMTDIHVTFGELDEALATGARALEIADRLGDAGLRIRTTTALAQAHYFRAEYERAVELATGNLAAWPTDPVQDDPGSHTSTSIAVRTWLVGSLGQLGRFGEAAEHEGEATRLADLTQHAYTVGSVSNTAGLLYLLKGDWPKARSRFEHAIEVLRSGDVVLQLPSAVACSAWALAQLGEASEALERGREGEQLLERLVAQRMAVGGGRVYHSLGRTALLLGCLDEARRLGDRVVESYHRQPGYVAWARHLLGDVAAHPDRFDPERAEAHYLEALALAAPRGMRPLVAHCHLGLARLALQTGKRLQADEHLTTAAAMYREMEMAFWLGQAEAALDGRSRHRPAKLPR